MSNPRIKAALTREEGRENHAYPDPLTKAEPWTSGIGHTGPEVHADTFKTDAEIDADYEADEAEATAQCLSHFPWLDQLNEARQAVLIMMVFQMGIHRVLGFAKALAAARDQHFDHAAAEMLDSAWAKQTPKRAGRMARQMATGEWQ